MQPSVKNYKNINVGTYIPVESHNKYYLRHRESQLRWHRNIGKEHPHRKYKE